LILAVRFGVGRVLWDRVSRFGASCVLPFGSGCVSNGHLRMLRREEMQRRQTEELRRASEAVETIYAWSRSILWNFVRPAIKRAVRPPAFYVLIVELAHRWRAHQGIKRGRRKFAIMIIRAAQANDHIGLRFIVANALNEAASADVIALKCFEIDWATIFDVNGFGASFRRE
jgi:hypothetical protein